MAYSPPRSVSAATPIGLCDEPPGMTGPQPPWVPYGLATYSAVVPAPAYAGGRLQRGAQTDVAAITGSPAFAGDDNSGMRVA
jgi:hypothetical protein